MIPYARLTPGPGFQAGRAVFYYLQRMVTAPPVRRVLSWMIALVLRWGQGGIARRPIDMVSARAVRQLNGDGVTVLPPLAPHADIARISQYFLGQMLVGPAGGLWLDAVPAGTSAACYSLETILACPGLLALINSPLILRIATEYLGCKPTLSSVGVRWTFPFGSEAARFQAFHRDVDDWRFLKLFIYLSDVDEGSGPHVFVRGSHNTAFGMKAKAYTRDELEAHFDPDSFCSVTGPMGTAFMADTLGVHRGGQPSTRPRLMLQVQYSLLPVFAFDYAPVEARAAGLDAYCNRLLVRTPKL